MKAGKPERHVDKIKNLVDNVYNGPGHSDIQLRQAVKQKVADHCGRFSANDLRLPEVLEAYVDKIALHAYKVTDADVDALRADGFSEDSIFELTISAALSAGIARLRCGMAALTGGEDAS